jgi:osmotically-inducible protein OsmY
VKAKYILDRDLSACDIHVSVLDGRVTLSGSTGSPDLVGRAVALALDTDGVLGVDSKVGIAVH